MATADQLKALIKSHIDRDGERFTSIALQVAAHEARQGHTALARDIKTLIEKSKQNSLKVIPFKKELSDLVISSDTTNRLSNLIIPKEVKQKLERILKEYREQEKLKKHGLVNRRKILIAGPPGTGKTMTASIIAFELHLPFYTIQMDKLITKFMGETSSKLRQIFDTIKDYKGIYLFDEFDAIGAERGIDNEVGEMRRVLNSFLQFIEQDKSDSFVIAATNNLTILDQALFRRFDDVLHYQLPSNAELESLIENQLGLFKGDFKLSELSKEINGLSHSEITLACHDAIKETILNDKKKVTKSLLLSCLRDRLSAYGKKSGE
jgi:SpoVK/Ycf46/Vps4 family AAA+-type ATPase